MFRWAQPIFVCVASAIACACGTSWAADPLEQALQEIPSFFQAINEAGDGPIISTATVTASSSPGQSAEETPAFFQNNPETVDPLCTDSICGESSLACGIANSQPTYLDNCQIDNSSKCNGGVFTTFFGLEGSKQPQDFGVNANFGGRLAFNYATPLLKNMGVGFQIGSSFVGSGNAVQVFELVGESTGRFQQYTTIGIFRRTEGRLSYGAAYDHLYQNSFDKFNLGQFRLRLGYLISPTTEIGTTANLSSRSEVGLFNSTEVRLTPIEMLNFYVDHQWRSQARTRTWIGVVDGHGEANAAFGDRARKNNQLTFGAEIFAPLNNFAAIYGEANIIMPADTGAVDAYLGMQFIPGGLARVARTNRFRPMFSSASSATFANDLKFE